MDLLRLLECAEILHGHPCPPLILGLRASAAAMARLGVLRATERELFAMVELGSDHYALGFVDGVQVGTGCSFGKDRIVRAPMGKVGMTLIDQRARRAVRIVVRREFLESLESTEWFRRCAERCAPWTEVPQEQLRPLLEFLMEADEASLLAATPLFPMGLEDAPPQFATISCDDCGESVLQPYLRSRDGKRLCIRCDEKHAAIFYR